MASIYEIEFIGKIISKKNRKRTGATKDGKAYATYGKSQGDIDRISAQVPPEVRDLQLMHPDMEFFFEVPSGNIDTDNSQTTILDILVKYGVLVNDSVACCNGKKTIHPATRGPVARTRVVITDTGIDRWPKPSRKKSVAE